MARGEGDGLVEVSPKATLTIAHVFVTLAMTAIPIAFVTGAVYQPFGQAAGQQVDLSKLERRLDDVERVSRNNDRNFDELERRVDGIRQCNCRDGRGHPIGTPAGSPAGAPATAPASSGK